MSTVENELYEFTGIITNAKLYRQKYMDKKVILSFLKIKGIVNPQRRRVVLRWVNPALQLWIINMGKTQKFTALIKDNEIEKLKIEHIIV